MTEHNLTEYLLETEYCDFNNHAIQSLANTFKKRYPNDQKKLAEALFYWVRDSIHYRVGLWNKTASQTLAERYGSCTNKANLLVALFRACNIPSAYCVLKVKGREFFGKITLPEFKDSISEVSVHIFAQAYISGRWLKCDPSTDVYLSDKTSHINDQSTLVDWDADSDALLKLDQAHILEEKSLLSNIDHLISKKPKTGKGLIVDMGNLYISFLRDQGKSIRDMKDVRPLFKKWLKSNSLKHHYVYSVSSLWHDIKGILKI
ncbi:MAG: transglutaminase family protein [Candidatus Pacebacteria bacterium]|nr:transglutaminase family protein [Candidatus Paceibacterota bacterium]